MISCLRNQIFHFILRILGNVRVPAPCQYAHKLVDLVGEHLRQQPAQDFNDKLYYFISYVL